MQRFDAARPHLESALVADSTHALACKALGYAYLQAEPRNLAGTRRVLQRYLMLQPAAADTAQVRALLRELSATQN